jgi:hypothetical protein
MSNDPKPAVLIVEAPFSFFTTEATEGTEEDNEET